MFRLGSHSGNGNPSPFLLVPGFSDILVLTAKLVCRLASPGEA